MSDGDLPEFYIEAAQVVVGMHPFQSEAGTGIAIEGVRRAMIQARSQAYEECAKIAMRQAPATQDWDDAPLQDLAKRIAQAIRQHSQKGEGK